MKRILFLTVLSLAFITSKAQIIEIGQDANTIKRLIEWHTKDFNKPDTYGNRSSAIASWDVEYLNGAITDVIQCFENQYYIDLRMPVSYCKHYLMKYGKLECILTQYENVSTEKLKDLYNTNSSENKIDEYYFTDDFEHYRLIYLNDNGLATIEYRKTENSNLPQSIELLVNKKLATLREQKELKEKKEYEEKLIKENADNYERLHTIYKAHYFSENGLARVCIDSEHKSGEMNYGYGDKLWGFISENGEYVIEPKYEEAFGFQNGFALVNTNKRYVSNYEFIDKTGQNIFNEKYSDARSFSENFAAVRPKNKLWGFINQKGEIVIDCKYAEVGDFKNGYAKVKFQDKWGYIDKNGKEIVIPQFSSAYDFSEGLAAVSKFVNYHYTEYGFIDTTGKYAFPPGKVKNITYKIKGDFCDGFALIEGDVNHTVAYGLDYGGVGFISKDGKAKVKGGFKDLSNFSEGLALAQNYVGHKYGFVNEKLQWIINPIFDEASDFHEGFAAVKINDNWGFIDKTGAVIINSDILKSKTDLQTTANYDAVSDFSEGLAVVVTRGKYGYINKKGEWVIKPIYTKALPFYNGKALVKSPDRKGWNYIDKTGTILFQNFQ